MLNDDDKMILSYAKKGFSFCCYEGHLQSAKWLYYIGNIQESIRCINEESIFSNICILGHVEIVKWLYSLENPTIQILSTLHYEVIIYNSCNVDILKWLYSLDIVDSKIFYDNLFYSSCIRGKTEIAKWLYTVFRSEIDTEFNRKHNVIIDDTDGIVYKENKIIQDFVFAFTCNNGYLDTVKWLFSLGHFNNNENNNLLFCNACNKGYIEMAKWFYSLGIIDINFRNGCSFIDSCLGGHLELSRWLHHIRNINVENIDIELYTKIFYWSCEYGKFEIVKWLYSLHKFDIHFNNEYLFYHSMINEHDDILDWLIKSSERKGCTKYILYKIYLKTKFLYNKTSIYLQNIYSKYFIKDT
jgi:hypothetical protein